MKHYLRVLTITSAAAGLLTAMGTAAPALAAGPAAARPDSPAVLHVGQIDQQDVAARGGCEPDTLVEPDVAISPFNSKIQVAVAHDCRFASGGAVDISYAWTHDGGATWHHAPVPGLTKAVGGSTYPRTSDPVVAFGPDGSVYISALEVNVHNCDSGVAVSRSTDGGATFGKPVYVQQSTTCAVSDDKNWLVADTQPGSPFYGRLYQFWTEFLANGAPQVVRWSDDQGRTWSRTHMVSSPKHFSQDSQPFIQPDGAITDVYIGASHAIGNGERQGGILRQGATDSLVAQTSFSGGASWTKPSVVTKNFGGGPAGIRCCLPLMAGDRTTGHMFAVWNAPTAAGQVELSSSADGRHWSHPVQVTPGHNPSIQYLNAAVAASNGRVFVAYGSRNNAKNHGNIVQQELTWSADGGARFAAPIGLGPPSNLRYAAVAGGQFPGDYTGLSATATRVTSAWCVSSRPPNPTAVYHQTLYAAVLRP